MALDESLPGGAEARVSVEEVLSRIENRDLIPWLQNRLRGNLDLSMFELESTHPFLDEFYDALDRLARTDGGGTRRIRNKWGVEHSGLCLLIAWTAELIAERLPDGGREGK